MTEDTATGRYTFGDGSPAERRLEGIAEYFNPRAEAFLRQHVDGAIGTAVDLGCGPGFTTRMLAQALAPASLVGLDISEDFLARAAKRCPEGRFIRHDVRRVPFPVEPDLVYCRFLLSHLGDAPALVQRWLLDLAPGRPLVIAIEEVEAISTDLEPLQTYLDVSAHVVATQGSHLWVGRDLADAFDPTVTIVNEAFRLPVPHRQAASWFHPNTVTIWHREPVVRTVLSSEEHERLSRQLAAIRDTGKPEGHAVWILRRVLLTRA